MLNKKWQWGALLLMLPVVGQADISGRVFQDFNLNGSFDVNTAEIGVVGVSVKAYNPAGIEASQALSDSKGQYTLSGLSAGHYRLEFVLNNPDFSAQHTTTGMGTTLQFVADGSTTADLSVLKAPDYCEANPKVAVTALSSGVSSGGNPNSLYTFNYDASHVIAEPAKAITGSIWGLAYDPHHKRLFSSAFLKRHVGLGTGGLGGIYVTDASQSPSTRLLLDIGDAVAVGNIGVRDVGDALTPSHDADAMSKVGRVGLGDLEISVDGSYLYVVNLHSKRVQAININNYQQTGTLPSSSDVSTIAAYPNPNCPAGEDRPFALKIKDQRLYLGVVCDAVGGTSADLRAYVYAYDLTSNTWQSTPVLSVNQLDYVRGNAYSGGTLGGEAKFNPWSDNMSGAPWTSLNPPDNQKFENADGWIRLVINQPESIGHFLVMHPQPILADIEFDGNGDMVLGIMDRAGHQGGYNNYAQDASDRLPWDNTIEPLNAVVTSGDIIRAKHQTDGSFVLESAGAIDGHGCNGLGTGGPNGGEYYCADAYWDAVAAGVNGAAGTQFHDEVSLGGLALLPRDNSVVMTAVDPVALPESDTEAFSSGLRWLDNTSGLYRKGLVLQNATTGHNIGKAAGMGDVELLCNEAPLEIGNRVWLDGNGNGIQDADETGLDGIDVTLQCGTDSATTTTNSGGQYYFSNASNAAIMQVGEACVIKVNTQQAPLTNYLLTQANADGISSNDAFTDIRDSDASLNANSAEISFTVGQAGENNHGLDIGFRNPPKADLHLSKIAGISSVQPGESFTYTLTLTNDGPDVATNVQVKDLLPNRMSYVSDSGGGTYNPTSGIWTVGTVAVGGANAKTLTISVTAN